MTGDIEAAGDLVSGALLARAVEGANGHGGAHAALCLNCGTRLIGPHCHRCGQGGHVHRTVGAIGHEIAHGVFHVEGKVWRTMPMLVLHPGRLTRRYIDGERVRFVSPLALFLFTVFLFFATVSWVGGDASGLASTINLDAHKSAFAGQLATARQELKMKQEARADLARDHQSTVEADHVIAALDAQVKALGTTQGPVEAGGNKPVVAPDQLAKVHTGWQRLDEGLMHANENPGLALYKLQSSAYKYSWLLIPLSTPFVAMLFLWRRRFGLYDHAVFVTYSLSFMMLLVTALTIAGAAGVAAGLIAWTALLVPPIHLFAQLRGTYLLGRLGAAWRTVVLLGFCFTALLGFAALLLIHGLTE